MDYDSFFKKATGYDEPYPFQQKLATESWPELLDVPTGMGKTAAVILAWLYKRSTKDSNTPRRLVYCLPMRVLVEQAYENIQTWLTNVGLLGSAGEGKISVHLLMGGSEDTKTWAEHPEEDMILIGTQDMLLSRALMRGYGMSRYQWPVHFSLLHNDAFWVFDEVQLMGTGLSTSVQFDLFHKFYWNSIGNCRFLWMSATPGEGTFNTRDRYDKEIHELPKERILCLSKNAPERNKSPLRAGKEVGILPRTPKASAPKTKDGMLDVHEKGRISLIVVNTVGIAQEQYKALKQALDKHKNKNVTVPELLLLHGRMRQCDRKKRMHSLTEFTNKQKSGQGKVTNHPGLIIVATQVVEAGVDISASRLWSEMAPWPSVVQRLGRLNRDGLQPEAKAFFWMPKADNKFENSTKDAAPNMGRIGPYDRKKLQQAKALLGQLANKIKVGASYREALDAVIESEDGKEAQKVIHDSVIRPPDFHDLFSTEPDLAGGFTDISRYVRNQDRDPDVHVFWGDFKYKPSGDLGGECGILCPVSAYVVRRFLKDKKSKAWEWDYENGKYQSVPIGSICPGMTLLLQKFAGGYSETLGWTGDSNDKPSSGLAIQRQPRSLDDDRWSETDWLALSDHLRDAEADAKEVIRLFNLDKQWEEAVICAALWHDIGKGHPRWQEAIKELHDRLLKKIDKLSISKDELQKIQKIIAENTHPGINQAKFPDWVKKTIGFLKQQGEDWETLRKQIAVRFSPGLRHEAASALAVWRLWQANRPGMTALAVYLIAAHHGKVRTVLRSMGNSDKHYPNVFGVRVGDSLPVFRGWYDKNFELDLSPRLFASPGYWNDDNTYIETMPSWVAIISELLGNPPLSLEEESRTVVDAIPEEEPRELGPFVLAFLEMLVITADHRASNKPGKGKRP